MHLYIVQKENWIILSYDRLHAKANCETIQVRPRPGGPQLT